MTNSKDAQEALLLLRSLFNLESFLSDTDAVLFAYNEFMREVQMRKAAEAQVEVFKTVLDFLK
jgi:hypothetical protein